MAARTAAAAAAVAAWHNRPGYPPGYDFPVPVVAPHALRTAGFLRALQALRVGGLRWWLALLAALIVALWPGAAAAGELTREALQTRFPPPMTVGERDARLPVWPVFERFNGQLALRAHAFETTDFESVAGYGGKPINLLVVMDLQGRFQRVELLSHVEPLFKSPAGTQRLRAFAAQYEGLSLQHDIQILGPTARRSQSETTANLHGVMAGTVSVTAIDRAVLESAAQAALPLAGGGNAARSAGGGPDDVYRKTGWAALAEAGLLSAWTLSNREVQAAFANGPGAFRDPGAMSWPDGKALDMWWSFVGLPQAGRNLLDAAGWRQVRAAREAGATVLMVLDSGRYPVLAAAGPDEHRAAVLALAQGGRRFPLQALPYAGGRRLSGARYGVARDAQLKLFTVQPAADGTRLDIEQPLRLEATLQRASGAGAEVATAAVARPYALADAARYRPQRAWPAWLGAWSKRGVDLAVLGVALALLSWALSRQLWLSASTRRLAAFRLGWLVFTVGFVGWWAQAQLTVVTLTSALDAAVAGRSLDFLLADPLALLLWLFTGVTLLVWGRGTFCGWLCPFGAMQELLSRLAGWAGWRPRRLARALDARLKRVKYGVLAVLLAGAAANAGWVDTAAEVEPFKTAVSALFDREWPYVVWAVLALAGSVAVYRAFCRYLCPLGAALALAGRLRRWGWIPRRSDCGTPCQTCRHRCAYQAIDVGGAVHYDECFQCLDCVAVYQHPGQCLPLVRQARAPAGRTIPIAVAPTDGPRP